MKNLSINLFYNSYQYTKQIIKRKNITTIK